MAKFKLKLLSWWPTIIGNQTWALKGHLRNGEAEDNPEWAADSADSAAAWLVDAGARQEAGLAEAAAELHLLHRCPTPRQLDAISKPR